MMKNTKLRTVALMMWFGVILMACNLSSGDDPLTVITPRSQNATATPDPNTPPPPQDADGGTINDNDQVEVDLYNLRAQVNGNRMMGDIYSLEGFFTRHVNSSQTNTGRGIGAARSYLNQQLQAIATAYPNHFQVTNQAFQTFYDGVESTQQNVIGILQGTEPGAGVLVIGAHYDSRTDDLTDGEGYAPGADDNGSGVAGVVELARVMASRPLRSTVVFVLFAAEEVGRQGSRAFVNDFIIPNNIDVVAMLNLDTIGSYNAPNGTINDQQIRLYSDDDASNRSLARHLARAVHFIGENHTLPLAIDIRGSADREGRYGDHFSFTEANYPAVRLIEALEDTPNREGRDTVENVEEEYLVATTQTILTIAMAIADGVQPPSNMSLRQMNVVTEDGQRQHNFVWNAVPGASRYIVALRRPGSLTYNTQFVVENNESGSWHRFGEFEAIAIACVDANGLVGRLSSEFLISIN